MILLTTMVRVPNIKLSVMALSRSLLVHGMDESRQPHSRLSVPAGRAKPMAGSRDGGCREALSGCLARMGE